MALKPSKSGNLNRISALHIKWTIIAKLGPGQDEEQHDLENLVWSIITLRIYAQIRQQSEVNFGRKTLGGYSWGCKFWLLVYLERWREDRRLSSLHNFEEHNISSARAERARPESVRMQPRDEDPQKGAEYTVSEPKNQDITSS